MTFENLYMKLLQLFVLLTISTFLISCGGQSSNVPTSQVEQQSYEWKLVTSWPKNFPGLGRGPETFS